MTIPRTRCTTKPKRRAESRKRPDLITSVSSTRSKPVRAAAAKVLAKDPDPATTQALIAAAGDKSWIVQTAALEALAKRGDRSVLQTVEQYLSDERDAVKFTAAAAVVRLGAIKAASKSARDH
jgi:HEAT repeat protein